MHPSQNADDLSPHGQARYEIHFDSRRSTDEETSNEEFEISVNGPSLAHCDGIVQEAMDK